MGRKSVQVLRHRRTLLRRLLYASIKIRGIWNISYYVYNKIYLILITINLYWILFLRIICVCQLDIKLIVAISSVIHIRIILITKSRLYGRYYIIIRHGFISSGLFCLINLIYNQTNRRLIFINEGIINFVFSLIIIWFLIYLCNVGSPFSLNLIGEILLLISLIYWFK